MKADRNAIHSLLVTSIVLTGSMSPLHTTTHALAPSFLPSRTHSCSRTHTRTRGTSPMCQRKSRVGREYNDLLPLFQKNNPMLLSMVSKNMEDGDASFSSPASKSAVNVNVNVVSKQKEEEKEDGMVRVKDWSGALQSWFDDLVQAVASFVETLLASFPEVGFWEVAEGDEKRLRKRDLIRSILRRLANLSLEDYQWRSDYFKKNEADRRVEESLARMMGEDAAYVRPMDASEDKIGPLGKAEKKLVEWLSLVIEEEGKRARLIASSNGDLIRPMKLQETGEGGPLSALENAAVSFLDSIRDSETERAKTMTLRPKDLTEEKRGPLGDLEARVVTALENIRAAESLRMEQQKRRGGEVVRPIDVPGPLGEMEMWYMDLVDAERQRGKERERNDGRLVRPKDAAMQGPLGQAERQVSEAVAVLTREEKDRLNSIKRVLEDNRPMDKDRASALGWTEAFLVGLFKGPQLFLKVVDRVKELLDSSRLIDEDETVLKDDTTDKESLVSLNTDTASPSNDGDAWKSTKDGEDEIEYGTFQ